MSVALSEVPRRLALPLVFSVLAATSCAGPSTSLTNMWRDPEFAPPMRSMLIMGVMRNPAARRNWEDRMSEELATHHVHAVPSYSLFPGELPDTDAVITGVQREGFDGVMIVHPLGTESETHYVPGYVRTVPTLGYDRWYGVYYNYYRHIYEPGYVETEQVVRHQIDVYSTGPDGRLVWTGTSESVDPASRDEVRLKVADRVVAELVSSRVLNKS